MRNFILTGWPGEKLWAIARAHYKIQFNPLMHAPLPCNTISAQNALYKKGRSLGNSQGSFPDSSSIHRNDIIHIDAYAMHVHVHLHCIHTGIGT